MTIEFKDTNDNYFTYAWTHHPTPGYKVLCTCGKHSHIPNTEHTRNYRFTPTSCPMCGTRRKGTKGKVNISHFDYSVDSIGDKQFRMSVHIRNYSPSKNKYIQNTKYDVGFNYLDKSYDIKVNGKNPRTENIANYYKRVLAKVPLNRVIEVLDNSTESAFWRCIFGIFSPSKSFGEALHDLIIGDYSGVEIISTSRFSPLLKRATLMSIYRDYQNHTGFLRKKGTNLRDVLRMTKGQINSMVRMSTYVMESQGVSDSIKADPLKILNTFYRISRILPIQHTEELIKMAVEEGHYEYICSNVGTLTDFMQQYNYTHDPTRFIRYLLRDIKLEQGILSPNDGMRYLRDYLRMSKDLGREPERYPSSLKKVHDIAAMNYRVVADTFKERNFQRRSEELNHLLHRGRRFSFILPQKPRDLVAEGTSLHHCVASYVDDVIRQNCAIVFMRSNKELDKSHVTIEVRNGRIVQARGQSNRQCTQEEKDAISAWANAKELEYRR